MLDLAKRETFELETPVFNAYKKTSDASKKKNISIRNVKKLKFDMGENEI